MKTIYIYMLAKGVMIFDSPYQDNRLQLVTTHTVKVVAEPTHKAKNGDIPTLQDTIFINNAKKPDAGFWGVILPLNQ